MNKIQQFAADLKARKNPKARTARNDTPAPAPPVPRNGDPADGSRLVRLKVELRKANERADKAEAALAARDRVQAVNAKVWRLQQEIARLRADRPLKLRAALKRIEALEAENAQLRTAPKGERHIGDP